MSELVEETLDAAPSVRNTADARTLRVLFDQLPALIGYWDRDLRNVIANRVYFDWLGRTPESLRGRHMREVLGEELFAKNLPHIQGALAGQPQSFDRTLTDHSSRPRHTHLSYVPDVVGDDVRGFFVLVTDVTPRVEAESALHEAQSIARLGSWTLLLDTEELVWSEELYRIFGVDPQTFVPGLEAAMAMIHPDDQSDLWRILEQAVSHGEPYTVSYRVCRPDGSVREVESRGRPALGPTGAVSRIAGTLQDVTEAKEAARELVRMNAELRQVNDLNADVISMLGHDVRAPLGVVLGYLEHLDDMWDTATEIERRDYLRTAQRSAMRLRGLVDDILTLATVDAGTIRPRAGLVDTLSLVGEVLEEVPGGATFAVTMLTPSPTAYADPFHVRQIVTNLVTNALRYGAAPYEIRGEQDDETVRISVVDAGSGVDPDHADRIFERFAAAPSAPVVGPSRSTGFGLYMSARLAQTNGGELTYTPRVAGRGPSFTLSLPTRGPAEA